MSWVIALIVGALAGWIASLIMKTDEQQNLLINIIIGIIGAFLGKWVFADVLNIGSAATAGALSFWGIFWAVIGAVVLIAILKWLKVFR